MSQHFLTIAEAARALGLSKKNFLALTERGIDGIGVVKGKALFKMIRLPLQNNANISVADLLTFCSRLVASGYANIRRGKTYRRRIYNYLGMP